VAPHTGSSTPPPSFTHAASTPQQRLARDPRAAARTPQQRARPRLARRPPAATPPPDASPHALARHDLPSPFRSTTRRSLSPHPHPPPGVTRGSRTAAAAPSDSPRTPAPSATHRAAPHSPPVGRRSTGPCTVRAVDRAILGTVATAAHEPHARQRSPRYAPRRGPLARARAQHLSPTDLSRRRRSRAPRRCPDVRPPATFRARRLSTQDLSTVLDHSATVVAAPLRTRDARNRQATSIAGFHAPTGSHTRLSGRPRTPSSAPPTSQTTARRVFGRRGLERSRRYTPAIRHPRDTLPCTTIRRHPPARRGLAPATSRTPRARIQRRPPSQWRGGLAVPRPTPLTPPTPARERHSARRPPLSAVVHYARPAVHTAGNHGMPLLAISPSCFVPAAAARILTRHPTRRTSTCGARSLRFRVSTRRDHPRRPCATVFAGPSS
jgi:hypothetical protein